MKRHPFARLERACARAVEGAFALAFPTPLQPVEIARKLVAAFEGAGTPAGGAGRRFVACLHPSDLARFAPEVAYLERQWTAMLGRLVERDGVPQRLPVVATRADARVVAGTVAIVLEGLAVPERFVVRVRAGVPVGAAVRLDRACVAGRDGGCDLVLFDPRVSRRHLEFAPVPGGASFRDLGSSNGTWLRGVRRDAGTFASGDVLVAGDTELVLEPADDA